MRFGEEQLGSQQILYTSQDPILLSSRFLTSDERTMIGTKKFLAFEKSQYGVKIESNAAGDVRFTMPTNVAFGVLNNEIAIQSRTGLSPYFRIVSEGDGTVSSGSIIKSTKGEYGSSVFMSRIRWSELPSETTVSTTGQQIEYHVPGQEYSIVSKRTFPDGSTQTPRVVHRRMTEIEDADWEALILKK